MTRGRGKRIAFGKGKTRGQRERGTMNATEKAYAVILDLRVAAGDLAEYRYEGLTLKLADDTRITPDFEVWTTDGELQLHEVKANWGGKPHIEDDAWVKLKVLVQQRPIRTFVCYPSDRTKQHFTLKEVCP